jgi:hypothetical protein
VRLAALVVVVCGCGRIAFDVHGAVGDGRGGDGGTGDDGGDGALAQAPAPILWFKLDENGGLAAYDSVTTTEWGLLQGATWVPGYSGSALAFFGTGDNVGLGALTELTNLSQLTVSAWIYPTGLVDDGQPHCVVAKSMTTTAGWAVLVNQNGAGSFGFESYYPTATMANHSAPGAVVASQWQHVVATWTGGSNATSAELYVNGTVVSGGAIGNATGARPDDSTIAASINCYGAVGLAGTIDEVKIFDVVLTAQQVASLM